MLSKILSTTSRHRKRLCLAAAIVNRVQGRGQFDKTQFEILVKDLCLSTAARNAYLNMLSSEDWNRLERIGTELPYLYQLRNRSDWKK